MMLIRTSVALALIAPPWSEPETVSSPHRFVDAPRVTFGASGRALAAWTWQDGGAAGTDVASRPPGAAAFGRERRLARGVVAGPVAYGRSRAVVVTLDGRRIAARFGSTTGRFGRTRTIASRANVQGLGLAAGADGTAAATWLENRRRVVVSLRRPGGRFGAPRTLATRSVRRVAVAVGARGHVLVTWTDSRGRLHARFKAPGRPFGPDDRLTARPAFGAELRPAVGPGGRALIGVGSQFRSEGGEVGTARFQVAVRPRGARRFDAARLLESRRRGQVEQPLAVIPAIAGNQLAVAWTGFDGTHLRARVAKGVSQPPADVSPPGTDAWLGDLAAHTDGTALAVWTAGTGDELAGQIQASVAPPARPFGPPEPISVDGEARIPSAAFDPTTGIPTVIWSHRPGTVAQASQRSLR